MNYTAEVTINVPRERVIELFDNPENLYKWQEGLLSFEPISGEPGQVGAKSKLVFDMDGRVVEMVETITSRNLPDEFSGAYDAKGVHNVVENFFYEDGPDKTRWVTKNEFEFSGFMKVMSVFMRGAITKQSQQMLASFKAFAEAEAG